MASPTDIGLIKGAAKNLKKVSFDYVKKSGIANRYIDVEPYELAPDEKTGAAIFWGFHTVHGTIHKFLLNRLSNVVVQPDGYSPKWAILMPGVTF